MVLSVITAIFKVKWKKRSQEKSLQNSPIQSNRQIINFSAIPTSWVLFLTMFIAIVMLKDISNLPPKEINQSPNDLKLAIIHSICPSFLMIFVAGAFISRNKVLRKAVQEKIWPWPTKVTTAREVEMRKI